MEMISVIVPVYNTGKYLAKCIQSILNQTYVNIEIIIVDDGSNDETAQICDKLSNIDTRVKVFHKKNEGVSVARNYGIFHSCGTYLTFVDSDDWIDESMYSDLVSKMEETNSDIVYCDIMTIYDNGNSLLDTFSSYNTSLREHVSNILPLSLVEVAGSSCRALYKASIVKDHNLLFPNGLKMSEDRIFNLLVLSHSQYFYYYKKAYYFRYMRSDSCVNSYHEDAVDTTLRSSKILQNIALKSWSIDHMYAYQKQLILGFYAIFNSAILHIDNSRLRYDKFLSIASTPELHRAVKSLRLNDFRSVLLRLKLYRLLYIIICFHLKSK